jgi:dolichyl-diphosphooligosaccharide--protein glycosyltransferase
MRRLRWLQPAVLVVIAAASRLAPWSRVFTDEGVRLVADSDTHYHVLLARQVVDGQFSRYDLGINFPVGAKVLWPPLFDWILAIPARAGLDLERSSAVLPVLFGVATVLVFARVAGLFLPRRAAFAAAIAFALSPGALGFTFLGRPDQHVVEGLLVLIAFGAFVTARPLVLGATLALAFATWEGSGVYLVVLGAFTALWHVIGDGRAARTLAIGCGAAAVVLLLAIGLLQPSALLDMGGAGVTGFHVLMVAVTGAFGWSAWYAARTPRGRLRRSAEVIGVALVLGGVLLWAGWRGIVTNLLALSTGNRWYQSIGEFQPLWTGNLPFDVLSVAGAGLVLAPWSILVLLRARRRDPYRVTFLLVWGALFIAATLARRRFNLYLAAPLALWTGAALEQLGARWRSPRLVPAAGALLLSSPAYLLLGRADVKGVLELVPALTWLQTEPAIDGREAVLADWSLGTVVRYYSGRPVLTSPAGTDGGAGAMEDAARFYLAPNEEAAAAALRARRIGYVIVENPLGDAHISGEYRAPDCVEVLSHSAALITYAPTPEFWGLPLARMYFGDGDETSPGRGDALASLRLLYETNPTSFGPPPLGMYKLFGVVPGARLRIREAPGAVASATVTVVTNLGRRFQWHSRAVVDASGLALLKAPYASGPNGLAVAGPYTVDTGGRRWMIEVPDRTVRNGGIIAVE